MKSEHTEGNSLEGSDDTPMYNPHRLPLTKVYANTESSGKLSSVEVGCHRAYFEIIHRCIPPMTNFRFSNNISWTEFAKLLATRPITIHIFLFMFSSGKHENKVDLPHNITNLK